MLRESCLWRGFRPLCRLFVPAEPERHFAPDAETILTQVLRPESSGRRETAVLEFVIGGCYGAVRTSKTQQGRPADPLLDRGRFRVRAQKSRPHDRKLWRAGGGRGR